MVSFKIINFATAYVPIRKIRNLMQIILSIYTQWYFAAPGAL